MNSWNLIWGALHKIGRFRNVPTVGTFVNEFNFNLLINVPTHVAVSH